MSTRARRLLYIVTEDWYFWSHRRQLAERAMRDGWEVALACNVTDHAEQIRASGVQLFPVPWRRGGMNPLSEAVTARAIRNAVATFAPGLVHCVALKPILHGNWLPARIPTINAVTGLGFAFINAADAPALSRARLLARVIRAGIGRALRRPGAFAVTQNQQDARLVASLGVREARTRIIPGVGIDLSTYRATPVAADPGKPLRVALVSRLLWDKGVGELVEAARLLAGRGVAVNIELVGTPDPANRASISESQLHAWVEEGVVTWRGWVDDVRQVWADADVAVLPSYREGFPKALLEAAACGRALVATDVPGCNAIVRPEVNGLLVPPRTAEPLADALERLAIDRAFCARLGANARAQTEAEHGLEAIGSQFAALYDEALQV